MKLDDALSRVCDDAERWNAKYALDDHVGFEAIEIVRALKIGIDWTSARGVYGSNETIDKQDEPC